MTRALPDDAVRQDLVALLDNLGRQVIRAGARVESKGDDGIDLVTSVDYAVQSQLEAALPIILPGSFVTGEENYIALPETAAPIWLVDPLDGTVNFVAGLPIYAIAVALLVGNVVVVAAVHDITRGVTYSAIKGGGAFIGDNPLVPENAPAKLATLSSGLIRQLARHAPRALDAIMGDWKLRNLGSQALHLCHAAQGHLRYVASYEARAWDDLAGALIATEAGMVYGSYAPGPQPAADKPQASLCAKVQDFAALSELLSQSCSSNS